jgi:hypothetical protein
MIFKSASQLSPNVEVAIDNVPVNYMTLQQITVEEKENMHNLAILEFAGMNTQLVHEYLNAPITFSIELTGKDIFNFHGYITFVEPVSVTHDGVINNSPFQNTRVYCFGSSYAMKSTYSCIWENKTISDIATEIANKYKFSVSVPNNSYRFPRLVQSSQSDWKFLNKASELLGYSVLMDGTHIRIWDPYSSLYQNVSYTMLLTIRGSRGAVSPQPGQILKFEGRIGAVTTDGSRSSDTLHVLDKSGQLLSVSNEDTFESSGLATGIKSQFNNVLSINADSFDMANRLVTGALRKKFPMRASVEVVSDPSIKPGGIVSINEYNTEFDGFWYVTSVRHELLQSHMRTYLELARDGLGTIATAKKATAAYAIPPVPALVGTTWISSKDYINVYN